MLTVLLLLSLAQYLLRNLSEDAQRRAVEGSVIKRMAEPEEVAEAILFLASDFADYVVGRYM